MNELVELCLRSHNDRGINVEIVFLGSDLVIVESQLPCFLIELARLFVDVVVDIGLERDIDVFADMSASRLNGTL